MSLVKEQQPQPLMTAAQADEMLRLARRADKRGGLLHFVVFTWLFGIFYWSWLALKWTAIGSVKLARIGWNWTVAYPVKWSVQLSRAAWPYVVRGVRTFHTRYGWRGWGIVAAVVVVLGIIGNIVH